MLLVAGCCPPEDHSGDCAPGGTGTIAVTSTGLPAGVTGTIHVTGASDETLTASRTFSAGTGPWSVTADRATAPDPLVRSVYLPTVDPAAFCLPDGGTQGVSVTWAPVATSNALWVTNSNASAQFLGFKSASLGATATRAADVGSRGALGGDIAFDRDGNVWVAGPTTTDATLVRFPSAQFATSGSVTPDREINLPISCFPRLTGVAFDANGNLFVASPCADAIYRVDASQLAASGSVTPSLTITVEDPQGLAFDRSGALWVAARGDSRLWRYDAAQLTSGSVSAPAFKLGVLATENPDDLSRFKPGWLAFDARGDLWANDFAANAFFRVAAAQTRGTATSDVQPQVRIVIGVLALLEGFAFDGEGGLWSAGAAGTLFRLDPAQLDVSSRSGAPTVPARVITSASIGSAANLAFFPAPAGLPLYSALP